MPRKRKFNPQRGDLVFADGKLARIAYRNVEDGVDFSYIWFVDGSNPDGDGAVDPRTGLSERSTYDRKAMGPRSNYWDDSTWVDEQGLRPAVRIGGLSDTDLDASGARIVEVETDDGFRTWYGRDKVAIHDGNVYLVPS